MITTKLLFVDDQSKQYKFKKGSSTLSYILPERGIPKRLDAAALIITWRGEAERFWAGR